jgi:hypothetical protein
VEPLALEGVGSMAKPVARRTFGRVTPGKLDQARLTPMQAAQQMHGIGEIARGAHTSPFDERKQMAMARRAVRGNARQMCLGNADRWTADGPIDCHPFHLVSMGKAEALIAGP